MKFKYKLINLEHLKCCNNEAIKTYFRYNGIHKFDDNDIKSLQSFIPKINSENRTNFNISYVIERLDKEFDLIKMDEELIINIELKSTYCDLEQCKENYKLLSKEYLAHEIYVFCYESETSSLLKYDNVNEKFIKVEFDEFNKILSRIKNGILIDININISPIYINPEVYLENQYTLSSSQNSAKNEVIKSDKKINIISGRAGSGKSLLALDLYRFYITSGYSVSYLTPFMLNDIVNEKLIDLVKMKTVKNFLGLSKPTQICIVDEAQRLSGSDIEKIQKLVSNKIIFLGDINQNIDYEQGFIKLYENRNEKEISLNDQVKSYEIYDSEYLIKTNIPTDLDQITISSKYGYFDNDQMRITYSIDDYQFIYDESTDFYKDFSEYKVNHGYKKYKDKIYYVKWQSYKLSNKNYYQEIMTLTYPITNNKYLSIKIITYGYKMSDEIINAALNYELELIPHSSINNGYINGHIIHNVNEDDDYKKVSEISRIKIEYSIPEKYNFTRDYNSMEITKNDINVSVNISKITQSNYDEIYNESSINYFENYKVEDQGSININDIVYEKYLESYTSFSSNYETYHYVAKLSEDYKLYIVYQKKSDSNISVDDLMKEILNFKITRIGESG